MDSEERIVLRQAQFEASDTLYKTEQEEELLPVATPIL